MHNYYDSRSNLQGSHCRVACSEMPTINKVIRKLSATREHLKTHAHNATKAAVDNRLLPAVAVANCHVAGAPRPSLSRCRCPAEILPILIPACPGRSGTLGEKTHHHIIVDVVSIRIIVCRCRLEPVSASG